MGDNMALAGTMMPFPQFDISERATIGPRWRKYLKRFEIRCKSLQLVHPEAKLNLLLDYAGEPFSDEFELLTVADVQEGQANQDIYSRSPAAIQAHYAPAEDTEYEKFIFREAVQGVVYISQIANFEANGVDLSSVLIVAITQRNEYHVQQAYRFMDHIKEQIPPNAGAPMVELTHERWPRTGAWTVIPILKDIYEDYHSKQWVLFCAEGTRIDLENLHRTLQQYDSSQPLFIGRALRDKEPTIIHHFAFHEDPKSFVYPDLAAGFVMSRPLIAEVVYKLTESPMRSDFSIDAIHELAMFIRDDGAGHLLTEDDTFCAGQEHKDCATSFPEHFPLCGYPVKQDSVFIAVKTCTKFHKDRVPVVKETWGKDARHLVFYSDTVDPNIPTETTGIPNTERGHCGKTKQILNRFNKVSREKKYDWLVVADDDALLSVERLRELLACYNPHEPVALGERYGYSVTNTYGYDYITGGGGMVLSHIAVRNLLKSDCNCGSNDSPDDMTLGMCLKRLSIPITHSPLFHQARPDDYAENLLRHQRPVSFHKHWMIDPISTYKEWFTSSTGQDNDSQSRDEL